MNPTIPFPIKSVTLLLCNGTDEIHIILDGPTPYPTCQYELSAKINAQSNHGEQWIKDNLPGITPKIINARSSYNK